MHLDLFLADVPPRQRSETLFAQIRDGISSGRFVPGDRLPTSRDLADELGVARSTITTVYGRLIAEGYVEARQGAGTFIADHRPGPGAATAGPVASSGVGVRRPSPPGVPPLAAPAGGWDVDLRTGRPDPALFPLVDWRRCVVTASQSPPPGYGHPAGHPELRRALAAWVRRSRGVHATPDQVLVTAGAQGAFDLCARVLVDAGDRVAVENPGYPPAWRAFEHHGARIDPVPVDSEGIVVAAIPDHSRAIYVTPSHQSPTGVILSASRRRELLDFAATHDAVIVEDDYDTEYRYVDRPLEPLHRIDTAGRVIYVGSFSKTLSPSLRLGFLVAPEPIVEALTATRAHVDTQPPHLNQAAFAHFLATGGFEKHLRRTHRIYRARRDHLTQALDTLRVRGVIVGYAPCTAGLHTLIRFHPDTNPTTIAESMRSRGVAIDTATDLSIGPATHGVILGYGLADTAQLERAIELLDAAVTTFSWPTSGRNSSAQR